MTFLFEPGFFSSGPVHVALVIGAVSALVSAVVGVFTVVRGQSFAGHALTDVATTGGSASFFYGMSPLLGFLGAGVIGAGAMDLVGVQRLRGRDIATGVVLGVATGVAEPPPPLCKAGEAMRVCAPQPLMTTSVTGRSIVSPWAT